jgi:predicted ATPase
MRTSSVRLPSTRPPIQQYLPGMSSGPKKPPPPFLTGAYLLPERVESWDAYPFSLPMTRGLTLKLDSAVTFLVGENGCGKSTLLQALAVLCGLPGGGGGRAQLGYQHDVPLSTHSKLAEALRPQIKRHPKSRWYFRADLQAEFARALQSVGGHHAYGRDAKAMFADRKLSTLSHGEAFLATLNNRARSGLLFFDEPESALSPQRQLTLLCLLKQAVDRGDTQVIIATHSPVLMTFPGATILSMDDGGIEPTVLEETAHFEITRGILDCPERYWKHLVD